MWFDAHLDLAYLAVSGRDMLAPLDPSTGPHPPAAVTLPSLREGRVRFALATIFTEPDGTGREGYPPGDIERAHLAGRAQLEAYLTWRDLGTIALDLRQVLRIDAGVGDVRGGMGVAEVIPHGLERRIARLARPPHGPGLHAGILVENADPIRSPDDLPWWRERGVVAIGMAWAKSSRYAGGNSSDVGLSAAGRELVRGIDELGIVHDVSHLSDRALGELLETSDRTVIASHSNCRALFAGTPEGSNQRHLTDATIAEIGRRGGVIGLNLYSRFLAPGLAEDGRATVADCVRHIEHIAGVMGHRRGVGLGSDMDGGFSANRLPIGINRPGDLSLLIRALANTGWVDHDTAGFAWRNWAEFWERQSSG
jgi:membrane dipeptidase